MKEKVKNEGKKIKVYNLSRLPVLPYTRFTELQGDFKKPSEESIEKLKKAIVERGFKYAFVAWHDKKADEYLIIDAHQRKKALASLDKEGYEIPDIPYYLIQAGSKKAAVEEIAYFNSSYGEINKNTTLFEDYDIDLDCLDIDIKVLEMPKILNDDEYEVNDTEKIETDIKEGDIYEIKGLGLTHRLMCGDSTNAGNVEKLLAGDKPILMVTDPPYGVEYDPGRREEAAKKGIISGGRRSVGVVNNDDIIDWTEAYKLFTGDVAYIWHASIFGIIIQEGLYNSGFEIKSQIIWAKNNLIISRANYHWKHEACWYAVRKGKKHNWQGSRKETTLWEIENNSAMSDDKEKTYGHSTQKPIECMARPIRNNTKAGEGVYDPFIGSGTTMVAAHQLKRVCFGMEINPKYCQIGLDRMRDVDKDIIINKI